MPSSWDSNIQRARVLLLAALLVLLALPVAPSTRLGLLSGLSTPTASAATPASYALTLDNSGGISSSALTAQVNAIKSLPVRPTVRVVAGIGTSPADYAQAIPAL